MVNICKNILKKKNKKTCTDHFPLWNRTSDKMPVLLPAPIPVRAVPAYSPPAPNATPSNSA